jgi:hypothetical protein
LDIIEEVNSIDFNSSIRNSNNSLTSLGGHPDHPDTWATPKNISQMRQLVSEEPQIHSSLISPTLLTNEPFLKKKEEIKNVKLSPVAPDHLKNNLGENIFKKDVILNSTIIPQ